MIEPLVASGALRTGQSSGCGTSGIADHCPVASSSVEPRAAFTVRISRSPTWPTTRAWAVFTTGTAMVTSRSMISSIMA